MARPMLAVYLNSTSTVRHNTLLNLQSSLSAQPVSAMFPLAWTTPQLTTDSIGGGSFQCNPNLYSCGFVYLSIISTWTRSAWVPGQRTIFAVLVYLQACVLVAEPWFNEPGREFMLASGATRNYNRKLHPQVVKFCMLDWLERRAYGLGESVRTDGVWDEIVKVHFLTNKQVILQTIKRWIKDRAPERISVQPEISQATQSSQAGQTPVVASRMTEQISRNIARAHFVRLLYGGQSDVARRNEAMPPTITSRGAPASLKRSFDSMLGISTDGGCSSSLRIAAGVDSFGFPGFEAQRFRARGPNTPSSVPPPAKGRASHHQPAQLPTGQSYHNPYADFSQPEFAGQSSQTALQEQSSFSGYNTSPTAPLMPTNTNGHYHRSAQLPIGHCHHSSSASLSWPESVEDADQASPPPYSLYPPPVLRHSPVLNSFDTYLGTNQLSGSMIASPGMMPSFDPPSTQYSNQILNRGAPLVDQFSPSVPYSHQQELMAQTMNARPGSLYPPSVLRHSPVLNSYDTHLETNQLPGSMIAKPGMMPHFDPPSTQYSHQMAGGGAPLVDQLSPFVPYSHQQPLMTQRMNARPDMVLRPDPPSTRYSDQILNRGAPRVGQSDLVLSSGHQQPSIFQDNMGAPSIHPNFNSPSTQFSNQMPESGAPLSNQLGSPLPFLQQQALTNQNIMNIDWNNTRPYFPSQSMHGKQFKTSAIPHLLPSDSHSEFLQPPLDQNRGQHQVLSLPPSSMDTSWKGNRPLDNSSLVTPSASNPLGISQSPYETLSALPLTNNHPGISQISSSKQSAPLTGNMKPFAEGSVANKPMIDGRLVNFVNILKKALVAMNDESRMDRPVGGSGP